MDGILVPGGFGQRAFEGKICAVRYARTHDVPFLGICLGMQRRCASSRGNVAGMPARRRRSSTRTPSSPSST